LPNPRRIAIAVNIVDPNINHQDVFAGVMRYALERGDWQCFIDEHPLYRRGQRGKARGHYDGIIARANPDMQRRAKAQGVPLVNTMYQHHKPGLAGVYPDPASMGRVAAEHLIGRGFQRFALMMDRYPRLNQEMYKTFIKHLEQAELEYTTSDLLEGDTEDRAFWVELEKDVNRFLDRLEPPIAIFMDSAIVARMLVELCEHRGLHVPQDVAVLSMRSPARLFEIPKTISSLQEDYAQIGYEAAAMLRRLMDGDPVPPEPVLFPVPGVVARASTDYYAVDDPLIAEALRYISTHLTEKMRVEQIADALDVSMGTLYNRFEAALGRTIGSEIRRLRINAARVMLMDQDLTVKEVASSAGFGGVDVMTRTFKKHFGMTPTAFRMQLQQKDP